MDARARLLDRLAAGPLLADGAMGTLLHARGVPQRAALDELVLTRPELIGTIHREYLDAGAELVETATFGANRVRLAAHGLEDQAFRIARRGVQLAREARDVAGRDAFVGGSVGPLGPPTRELAHRTDAEVRAAYREQVDAMLEGGADLFVFETFTDLGHLLLAVDEAASATRDIPIIASLTLGDELVLPDGTGPAEAAAALGAARIDVLGVNCGGGPQANLDGLEALGRAGVDRPRSIMPNAGLPQRLDGRFVYAATPAYLGSMVARFVDAGARIIGGCCGTTPEHIAAMRGALDAIEESDQARERARAAGSARPASVVAAVADSPSVAPVAAPPPAQPVPDAERPEPTGLAQALAAGRFVVSVEIDPPRSIRIERTLDAARQLRDAGVDLLNVSDSAMARVRMGALAVAFAIQREVGVETLIHFTTRDRNLMAIESELLGAHALGIRDILALTGDPPRVGDYPTGTGVWDVDSIGLVEILARLNRGEDAAGSPIGQPAGFTIACALDPTAPDQAAEWDRLERKLAAGAQLVMTQPLYSIGQVEALVAEARRRFGRSGIPVPVLLGLLPLQSSRHAEFLHHEVPGITIPDETRAAMAAAGDRGSEVGLDQALALLLAVRELVSGTYLMPSFGRYEQCADLVRSIRSHDAAAAIPG